MKIKNGIEYVEKEIDISIKKNKENLRRIENKIYILKKEMSKLKKMKIEAQNRYENGKVTIVLPERWNKFYSVLNCPKCGNLSLLSYWHNNQKIIGIGSDGDFLCVNCLMWFHDGDNCITESHLKDNKMVFDNIYNDTSKGVEIERD
jgi:hypothetical protein